MNDKGTKRARNDHPEAAATAQAQLPGRDQLLLTSPALQARHGKKYCGEAELLPLLLAHGLVRRVRAIDVLVHPIGGDNFNVTLGAALPAMGEAKAEIARVQGAGGGVSARVAQGGGASRRGSGSRGRCGGGAVRC
jgi:hypothetical protein